MQCALIREASVHYLYNRDTILFMCMPPSYTLWRIRAKVTFLTFFRRGNAHPVGTHNLVVYWIARSPIYGSTYVTTPVFLYAPKVRAPAYIGSPAPLIYDPFIHSSYMNSYICGDLYDF